MALETNEKEIGGVTYKVTKLGAMRAVKLLNRFGRVLGPALAKGVGAIPPIPPGKKFSDLDLSKIDMGKIGEAISSLFSSLDDATLETLLRDLLSGVSFEQNADGMQRVGTLFPSMTSTAAFDAHFADRLAAIPQVAAFAFGVNFDGFSGALAALRRFVPGAAGAEPNSETSTT